VLQSDTEIFGITESVGLTLVSNVSVDAVSVGDWNRDLRDPGTIYAGTHVNSFLLHFDPYIPSGVYIEGTVEFSSDILGVIFTGDLLNASDSILGSPSTTYAPNLARGFEPPGTLVEDFITVEPTGTTVVFNATAAYDQVRVITKAILEILIDLGPDCLNINGHGVIPVTILGSASFDVTQIDMATVLFGGLGLRVRGNKGPLCSFDDDNGDGILDLVCHFEDDAGAWLPGNGQATLAGKLFNGFDFEGTTDICIVP
jgi:hypothetical protein